MKLGKANTRAGVAYNIAEFEDSDVLGFVQDPTKLTRITDVLNMYLANKTVSVEASDDLSTKIEENGFKREMQSVVKDGETVEVPADKHDTNGKFIDSAVGALVAGEWRPAGFTLPSGDDKHKEAAALKFLQSLAETCGNGELNGTKCYIPSLEKTTRTGTGGLLPKWALETATQIINAGLAEKSRAKHEAGYTNSSGFVIAPIVCDELQVAADSATPEEKQAVAKHNQRAVAKWCYAAQKQENEQRAKQGVAQFA